MMFCPKCKSILGHKKLGSKIHVFCKCGYSERVSEGKKLTDTPRVRRIEVIDGVNRLAVHDHRCEKCGHNKAEIIEKGQMYSDEDDVVLYRCGKCGHTIMMDAKVK